jgi:hypothetical protein
LSKNIALNILICSILKICKNIRYSPSEKLGSWNSLFDIAMDYRLNKPGLIPGRGKRFFSSFQTGSGVHPVSYAMRAWPLSLEVKWSSPLTTKVMNGEAMPPLPRTSS